jgi:hypothetical protein
VVEEGGWSDPSEAGRGGARRRKRRKVVRGRGIILLWKSVHQFYQK